MLPLEGDWEPILLIYRMSKARFSLYCLITCIGTIACSTSNGSFYEAVFDRLLAWCGEFSDEQIEDLPLLAAGVFICFSV